MEKFILDPDVEYIKIHGLQRSGTNYISALINENFHKVKSLINVGGWKHGHYCAPWTLDQEVHVVTIIKNPYSWLVSVYNYWKPSYNFDKFVKSKITIDESAGHPFSYRAANPIQHWNDMNFHWLSIRLNNKKSLMIPYECLISCPEGVISSIGRELSLSRKSNFYDEKCTMHAGEEEPKSTKEIWDKIDYYSNEDYMSCFPRDTLEFVNDQIDTDLMRSIGYEIKR